MQRDPSRTGRSTLTGARFSLISVIFRSLIQPRAEKDRQDKVNRDSWPQQRPEPFTGQAEVEQVERRARTISEHAAESRAGRDATRPASQCQRDQADAANSARCYSGRRRG
jgi:hypothetical protein